jgi:hypothetical protein
MALVLNDRVQQTATANTTVSFTLTGSVTGFQSFAVVGNGNTTYYSATDASGNWEVGVGTYSTTGPTLTRTSILSSSNSGSAVTFSGTVNVFVTYPSEKALTANIGQVGFYSNPPSTGTWLETGATYSKASYPALASALGDIPDIGEAVTNPVSRLPYAITFPTTALYTDLYATNGSVTVIAHSTGILVTTDGITLSPVPTTAPNANAFNKVIYANSRFIAVGAQGYIISSTDGYTWKQMGSPQNTTLQDIAYFNGYYICSFNGSAQLYLSQDMIQWTPFGSTLPASATNAAYSITKLKVLNGALYVLTTSGLYRSTTGNTFTCVAGWTNFVSVRVYDIYYSGSLYYTAGTGVSYTSTDGINWTGSGGKLPFFYTTISAPSFRWNNIYATSGTTTIVSTAGSLWRTTDGANWYSCGIAASTTAEIRIGYANSRWFAFINNINSYLTFSVDDGVTWVTNAISGVASALQFTSIAYGAGLYVMVTNAGTIYSSPDTLIWTLRQSSPNGVAFTKIVYANGYFVAINNGNGTSFTDQIYTSTNGTTWTAVAGIAAAVQPSDVIYANSVWVIVSSNGAGNGLSSPDAITWTSRSQQGSLVQVVYANSIFAAVGGVGVATSTDGLTWTSNASADLIGNSIAWTGSKWIVPVTRSSSSLYTTSTTNFSTWTIKYDNPHNVTPFGVVNVGANTIFIGVTGSMVVEPSLAQLGYGSSLTASNSNSSTYTPLTSSRLLAYGASTYVAAFANNTYYSSDAINWTATNSQPTVTIPMTGSQRAIYYLNSTFFIVSNTSPYLNKSTDGITWTACGTNLNQTNYYAMAYGAGTYVIADSSINQIAYSTNPGTVNWTLVTVGTGGFYDVTYANSLFVAVGTLGKIFTSPDGITWTSRLSLGSGNIRRVAYLNSLFIAMIDGGSFYTSTDGLTWTNRASNTTGNPYDITYAAGIYVAVGSSDDVVTSTDGFTWTSRRQALIATTGTQFPSLTFYNIVWTGTYFVIKASAVTYTSPDGITWTPRTSLFNSGGRSLTYNNGKLIAFNNSFYQTSSDSGVTWTKWNNYLAYPFGQAYKIASNGSGTYVAVGTGLVNFSTFSTSTDLMTWTPTQGSYYLPAANAQDIAWDSVGSQFVVPANGSGAPGLYFTSSDGFSWTPKLDQLLTTLNTVAPINNKIIALTSNGAAIIAGASRQSLTGTFTITNYYSIQNVQTGNVTPPVLYSGGVYVTYGSSNMIMSSTDGITWTPRVNFLTNSSYNYQAGCVANGIFFVLNSNGLMAYSSDGTTWYCNYQNGLTQVKTKVAYGAGVYVTVGVNGIYTASDLVNWTNTSAVSFVDVIYEASVSLFVAVGASGSIYTSPDGTTWTTRTGGAGNFIKIYFANSVFIALSSTGMFYSSNGTSWTAAIWSYSGAALSINARDVIYANSLFVAVSTSNSIYTSSNGSTWTLANLTTSGYVTFFAGTISFGASKFVISAGPSGGGGATYLYSTDGVNWSQYVGPGTDGTTSITAGAYAGNKFFLTGSGLLAYSTDGINFSHSTVITPVATSNTRTYKLNNKYFACTNGGLFYSSDGLSWSWMDKAFTLMRSVAYDGTYYYAVTTGVSTSSASTVFRSADGATWSKLSTLFLSYPATSYPLNNQLGATTYPTAIVVASDLVFTSSKLVILSTGGSPTGAGDIGYEVMFNSSDGITWSPVAVPSLGGTPSLSLLTTDGSTLVWGATNMNGATWKSTDAGGTWSLVANDASVTWNYSGGVWASSTGFTSTDLSNWQTAHPAIASNTYVSGNYMVGVSNAGVAYKHKKGGAYTFKPFKSLNPVSTVYKPMVVRGSTYMIPTSPSGNWAPYLFLEGSIYSYNNTTTFYVPPVPSETGQQAYIYAGP